MPLSAARGCWPRSGGHSGSVSAAPGASRRQSTSSSRPASIQRPGGGRVVRVLVALESGGGEHAVIQRMRVAGDQHRSLEFHGPGEQPLVGGCVEVVPVRVAAVPPARVRVIRRVEVEHGARPVVAIQAVAPVQLVDLHASESFGEPVQVLDRGGVSAGAGAAAVRAVDLEPPPAARRARERHLRARVPAPGALELVVDELPGVAAVLELAARVRCQSQRLLQLGGTLAQRAEERHQSLVDVVVHLERGARLGEQDRGAAAEHLDIAVVTREQPGEPRRQAALASVPGDRRDVCAHASDSLIAAISPRITGGVTAFPSWRTRSRRLPWITYGAP